MTATIRRVARPRGELTAAQKARLQTHESNLEEAKAAYREAVLRTLAQGASFAEVSKFTGLSTNTLQRWKREGPQ